MKYRPSSVVGCPLRCGERRGVSATCVAALQAALTPRRSPSQRRTTDNGQRTRAGLTLLEVIVSMAIFLLALVPIMRLISLGTEHAMDVNQRSQASMLCQSKMDSVKAGVESLSGSGTVEIGTQTWNYTIESSQTEVENLYTVKVTVHIDRPDGKKVEETLVQMVIDPSVRGSTLSIAAAAAANAAATMGGQ